MRIRIHADLNIPQCDTVQLHRNTDATTEALWAQRPYRHWPRDQPPADMVEEDYDPPQ